MRLPSTRQLQYFVALVDKEHFGQAAEASNVSQSAFSNAIRELETTRFTMHWNGQSDAGSPVPSGVYLIMVDFGFEQETTKVVLVR